MFLIIVLILLILFLFGVYKVCIYLNEHNKKINDILLKLLLSSIFIFIILILYFGIDGYLNGTEGIFCGSSVSDCYEYKFNGFVFNIYNMLRKNYWMIIVFVISLIYVIVSKIKYKVKIINHKVLYFAIILAILLISLIPFYDAIFSRVYFHFNKYNYELVINNYKWYDNNIYQIYIYDKKINVIKKENVPCVDVCGPFYNGEYELKFSKESMEKIYDYVNQTFNNEELYSTKGILYDDITDENEQKIITAIITNNEDYLIEINNKK